MLVKVNLNLFSPTAKKSTFLEKLGLSLGKPDLLCRVPQLKHQVNIEQEEDDMCQESLTTLSVNRNTANNLTVSATKASPSTCELETDIHTHSLKTITQTLTTGNDLSAGMEGLETDATQTVPTVTLTGKSSTVTGTGTTVENKSTILSSAISPTVETEHTDSGRSNKTESNQQSGPSHFKKAKTNEQSKCN